MIEENMFNQLREVFGRRLQENVLLANYTTMHVGGPADALLITNSADQLATAISTIWEMGLPIKLLGSGSNLIISDRGIRAVVVVNRAHNVKINIKSQPMIVWAESGALMVNIGKKLTLWELNGMEWASTIPGTVGGAVYGNAGAFGGETCGNLISAEVLHQSEGRSDWPCDKLEFTYRSSKIKLGMKDAVILAASFSVEKGKREEIISKVEKFKQRRWRNQPPGASVGSVFRNPPDDKAGRLIEEVGLKGKQIGGAVISPIHANFIINESSASAKDILDLLTLAHDKVLDKFGIDLIPEIEVIGDWENLPGFLTHNQASKVA
jgi:UDP-N-acetylmuramate dehydrogenase